MLEVFSCTSQRSLSDLLGLANKPASAECGEENSSVEEQGPCSNQSEPGGDIRIQESREPCAASNYQCDFTVSA